MAVWLALAGTLAVGLAPAESSPGAQDRVSLTGCLEEGSHEDEFVLVTPGVSYAVVPTPRVRLEIFVNTRVTVSGSLDREYRVLEAEEVTLVAASCDAVAPPLVGPPRRDRSAIVAPRVRRRCRRTRQGRSSAPRQPTEKRA